MVDFGSSTFCNAGVLEFTAGSAELCRDREPGIAAVAGGSFWSQSSNIAEKKIKELLLGYRVRISKSWTEKESELTTPL